MKMRFHFYSFTFSSLHLLENSFAKTSSALFRHLPEYLEGRTPKKNVLSTFKKNFTTAKSRKQGTFFFGVAERSEAVAERFIPHRDFVGKKFGFCSGDTALERKGIVKRICQNFVRVVPPSEARQWRNDSFHIGILLVKSSDFVQKGQPKFRIARHKLKNE